jgi:hypothetical protein
MTCYQESSSLEHFVLKWTKNNKVITYKYGLFDLSLNLEE